MPDLALDGPVDAYRSYVGGKLPGLLAAVRTLDADVAAGDLDRARADWLPAHLDYERLGAAYNSFGDFDARIDGLADGLPLGTADPSWSGFHRIEYGLWHGATGTALKPLTDDLVQAVLGLTADFTSADIDPGDLPLRSHEILENALQVQLTGRADYGSGTVLATVGANLDGTRAVLATLDGLIAPRDPRLLAVVARDGAAVQADLSACGAHPDRVERQKLDGDLGELLEQLSTVPGLLQGRTGA
jgi:iron uptake system EfeUOB component EfeO/EfeM